MRRLAYTSHRLRLVARWPGKRIEEKSRKMSDDRTRLDRGRRKSVDPSIDLWRKMQLEGKGEIRCDEQVLTVGAIVPDHSAGRRKEPPRLGERTGQLPVFP